MADKKQNIVENKPTQHLTPEQKQREKERIEREKKEEEELKKKLEEKLKKKKEKEKRIAAKKKKEEKRRKSLINLPFKLHMQISLLVTLLSSIVMFYGFELELLKTLYLSFMIFVTFYLGTGIVMVGIFFLISEEKLAEAEELRKIEELNKVESKTKQDLEIEEMAKIEKEIAARKMTTKLLREENFDNHSVSLDDDFDLFGNNNNKPKQVIDLGEINQNDNKTDEDDEIKSLDSKQNFDIFEDSDEFMEIDFEDEKVPR